MTMSSAMGAAGVAAFALLLTVSAAAADRLIWLHMGAPVLGSINLDHFPELGTLCPQASWAEVKQSRTPGLFAYRCEDGSFLWPFPTYGQSPELRQRWLDTTGAPPSA